MGAACDRERTPAISLESTGSADERVYLRDTYRLSGGSSKITGSNC
jgi:hypothetical protein